MIWACSTTSPQPLPSSTRSSMLRRYMMAKSGPQAWRMRDTISSGNRTRLASGPPHWSVRWLVRRVKNWLIR